MIKTATQKADQHLSMFDMGAKTMPAPITPEQKDHALNRMAMLELSESIDRLCTVILNVLDSVDG